MHVLNRIFLAISIIAWPAATSAQIRVATGVEQPDGGAASLQCDDAAACTAGSCADGLDCVSVGGADGCVAPGEILCCDDTIDCPTVDGHTPFCSKAGGADSGVCVLRADGEDDLCSTVFQNLARLATCFTGGSFADGDCDEDGESNATDNCQCTMNTDQLDCDVDGIGAACEVALILGAPPEDYCGGAESWEEVECVDTGGAGMTCDCYSIEGTEDPFCAIGCVERPALERTRALCNLRPDGGPAVDAGGRDAGSRDAGSTSSRDAGGTVMMPDAGATGGGDDGSCALVTARTGGATGPAAWLWVGAIALLGAIVARRRRG